MPRLYDSNASGLPKFWTAIQLSTVPKEPMAHSPTGDLGGRQRIQQRQLPERLIEIQILHSFGHRVLFTKKK